MAIPASLAKFHSALVGAVHGHRISARGAAQRWARAVQAYRAHLRAAQRPSVSQQMIRADDATSATIKRGAKVLLSDLGVPFASEVVDVADAIGDVLGLGGPLMPGAQMVAPDTGQVSFAGAVGLTSLGISGSKKEF